MARSAKAPACPAPGSAPVPAGSARAPGQDADAGGSTADLDRMWSSQLRWWHWAAAIVLGLIFVVSLLEPPGQYGRWPNIVTVAVIAVLYATLGVRALAAQGSTLAAAVYLVTAWACVLGTQMVDPQFESWLFYFVLFPHIWAMLSLRTAMLATVVVLMLTAGLGWYIGRGQTNLLSLAATTLISLMLSVALGLLISRMFREADARATIIDELRSTQAQLAATERDRGVLAERERMAQEIHDTLAQGFTSILALSRAADAALARADVDTARQRLALVQTTAAENLHEARVIVAETAPGHLDSRTLAEALERVVAAVRGRAGLDARFELVGQPTSSGAATDLVLLRAAQECVANIRRHAGASTVRVRLTYPESGPVTLTVTDDGVGFDATRAGTGFGLDGIRTRAEHVGGRAEVVSAPGSGTTVEVQVPR